MDDAGIADIDSDATTVDETPVDTESESAYDFAVNEVSDSTLGVPIGKAFMTVKRSDAAVVLGCAV